MRVDTNWKNIKARQRLLHVLLSTAVIIVLAMERPLPAAMAQLTFASPGEAVNALAEALQAKDQKALEAIFGPVGRDIVDSGDPVEDKLGQQKFLDLFKEKNSLEQTGETVILSVGSKDWPFPVPIVNRKGSWYFDSAQGVEEILARRIGKNELSAIQFCLAYVDAQQEYVLKDRDSDGLLEYARKFFSNEGRKDGLYWKTNAGEEQSPLGPSAAMAEKQGYRFNNEKPTPYLGYYYRILTGQGANAQGGAYDYLVKGKMIGGFGLVAYPAQYENTGVMTFIVSYPGVVYQKDLGPNTEQIAQTMTLFDPDSTWQRVEDEDSR
ncbi:MAG: DUF2950 domain-containing protein [Desulforhopalus sp.]